MEISNTAETHFSGPKMWTGVYNLYIRSHRGSFPRDNQGRSREGNEGGIMYVLAGREGVGWALYREYKSPTGTYTLTSIWCWRRVAGVVSSKVAVCRPSHLAPLLAVGVLVPLGVVATSSLAKWLLCDGLCPPVAICVTLLAHSLPVIAAHLPLAHGS